MAIGTGDGEYYESRIDHQLATFEDPVRSPTEPAGALKSSEGSKVAMNDNRPPFPEMGGLTAEIDKLAGGFSRGAAEPGVSRNSTSIGGLPPGTRIRAANENSKLPIPRENESAKDYFQRLNEPTVTTRENNQSLTRSLRRLDESAKEGYAEGKAKGEFENIGNKKPLETADEYIARIKEYPEYKAFEKAQRVTKPEGRQIDDPYRDAIVDQSWNKLIEMQKKLEEIERRSKFSIVPKDTK